MYSRKITRSAGHVTAADLSCLVKEENNKRKEFFTAEWRDLTLSTRPEPNCNLNEMNNARKESYRRQHQTQFVVQQSPYNIMRMGRFGEKLTEYKLPYKSGLPVPVFKPVDLSAKFERVATPPELQNLIEFERVLSNDGSCQEKREVAQIKSELPPVIQPSKLRRTFSRSMSQEAQRG
ncbi:telethonin [Protopterus annectens]|uniref:telethonin n=1 Tax=Protopterus annectens TaxID=7888 RepID=UPI001CF9D838|nr:telethonin [Protopterus annectens]